MEERQVEMWNDRENMKKLVKQFGKYGRKLWKDMKNMEEK